MNISSSNIYLNMLSSDEMSPKLLRFFLDASSIGGLEKWQVPLVRATFNLRWIKHVDMKPARQPEQAACGEL